MEQPISEISHHRSRCCEDAHEWLVGTYASKARTHAGSGWTSSLLALIEDFEWGPTQWPIHWCELMKVETIDCGVFSALARSILCRLGIPAYPAQVIHRKTEASVPHIRGIWKEAQSADDFFAGSSYSYHELCLIDPPESTMPILFDTSYGIRFGNFSSNDIYDAVSALRVESPRALKWYDIHLKDGNWHFLGNKS